MQVTREQAKEFLDALNDYISNCDWTPEMVLLTEFQAKRMDRATMDAYLIRFLTAALEHLKC